jgi:uncharacterized protein (DUF1697 family)
MGDLRQFLTTVGMRDAQTLLQSGNVVFKSTVSSATKLEQLLEDDSEKHLGVKTDFFVRTASEWQAIISANPFTKEARSDPGYLLMMCLKHAPDESSVTVLQKAITGRETVKAVGRQAYFVYPDGQGRSRLTLAMIEKKLGTRGTGRNWNTVLKLGDLAEAL